MLNLKPKPASGLSGDAPDKPLTTFVIAKTVVKALYRNFFSGYGFQHVLCFPSAAQLEEITAWYNAKALKANVFKVFPSDEVHAALVAQRDMKATGKIIVKMGDGKAAKANK